MEKENIIRMKYDFLIRQLSIQYGLLLGFRSLCITINIFILPFALDFAFSEIPNPIPWAGLSIVGIMMCLIWREGTNYRRYNVFYLEYLLIRFEKDQYSIQIDNKNIVWGDFQVQERLLSWQKNTHDYKKDYLSNTDIGSGIMKCQSSKLMRTIRISFLGIWSILLLSSFVYLALIPFEFQ